MFLPLRLPLTVLFHINRFASLGESRAKIKRNWYRLSSAYFVLCWSSAFYVRLLWSDRQIRAFFNNSRWIMVKFMFSSALLMNFKQKWTALKSTSLLFHVLLVCHCSCCWSYPLRIQTCPKQWKQLHGECPVLENEEISLGMVKKTGLLSLCFRPRAFMDATITLDCKTSRKKYICALWIGQFGWKILTLRQNLLNTLA